MERKGSFPEKISLASEGTILLFVKTDVVILGLVKTFNFVLSN